MLVQMMYASRVCAARRADTFYAISEVACKNNQRFGIGGVLLYDERFFFQAVEGDRGAVNGLLRQLVKDPRHTDFHLLRFSSLTRRLFSRWSMGRASDMMLRAPFLFQHGEKAEFDPYTLSEQHAAAVVGHIAGLPPEQIPTLGEDIIQGQK